MPKEAKEIRCKVWPGQQARDHGCNICLLEAKEIRCKVWQGQQARYHGCKRAMEASTPESPTSPRQVNSVLFKFK